MSEVLNKTACFHCGEDCLEETIVYQEKSFCCQGCRTVFELLNETGLGDYYDIETTPGKKENSQGSHDYLDIESVANNWIDFKEGSQNRVTFHLPAIHCSACVWLLERLGKLKPGIIKSEVNFIRRELTVLFNSEKISLKELVILLERIGYSPDLQQKKESRQKKDKTLIIKLGIAGFVFGNTMLFSFPEYLSVDEVSLGQFQTLFRYLSLALSFPILLYSGNSYLISAWKSLQVRFLSIDVPIAIGMITLFARSAYEVIAGVGSGYFDSLAGLVFFLLIGKWYQSRTYSAIAFDRDYKSYFPIALTRISNQREEICLLENIQVGDRLRILNNQIIPADSVLISENSSIDYSFVTGESDLISKTNGDLLYAGGRQTSGAIEIEIVKPISQSYLTGLWNQQNKTHESGKLDFTSTIDTVSHWFSPAVLIIAFSTLFVWFYIDPNQALNAFTAVLIVACPCALALSMPFTLGSVTRVLGKQGFYIKNAQTLERLASINTCVFDKTGTLTKSQQSKVTYEGESLNLETSSFLKSITSISTHPLNVAITKQLEGIIHETNDFQEFAGKGIVGSVNGHSIKLGSAAFCGQSNLSTEGSEVHVQIDDEYFGKFVIKKELRTGISAMINRLNQQFQLHLLSGDNESEKILMAQLFGKEATLKFQQSPQDKKSYLEMLEQRGNRCLMLGDGLNDAGALKAASVGVAVADDVYSFSPACDAILQAEQLSHLDQILTYVKKGMTIAKISIVISLLYNVIGLSFAIRSELSPITAAILMPVSSVTVVGFVTLMTNWLARRQHKY